MREVILNQNNCAVWEGLIVKVNNGELTKPALIGNTYGIPRVLHIKYNFINAVECNEV